jgi:hypothetical protein
MAPALQRLGRGQLRPAPGCQVSGPRASPQCAFRIDLTRHGPPSADVELIEEASGQE